MDQLTKYLISELIDGRKVTAVYGGEFKPPTKEHFNLVKKTLEDNKQIDKVIIYVGNKAQEGITQEQALQVWGLFKEMLGDKIEIIPSSQPLKDVETYIKNNPNDLNLKLSYDEGLDSIGARKALKSRNKEKFLEYLPEEMPDTEKESIWGIFEDVILKETPGKAAPYGSGYKKVNEIGIDLSNYSGQVLAGDVVRAPKGFPLGGKKLEKSLELKVKKISREGVNRYKLSLEDSDGKNYTIRNYQMDGEYKGEKLPKWGLVRKSKENVNENTIPSIDIVQKCAELTQHMINRGYNIQPLPTVKFIGDDVENAGNFLGKTAYYDPEGKVIVLYTYGRHPKDIVRSFAHEMIHHEQNLEGHLGDITTTDTTKDAHLNDLEKEANLLGTMEFRTWTDSLKEKKDPFGLNQFARELAQGLEETT